MADFEVIVEARVVIATTVAEARARYEAALR